jgi:V/A-type H+-transporting ATPase subunit F
MEIAVVGNPEFTLGFQLAGITNVHNPSDSEQIATVLQELLGSEDVGIVVIDSDEMAQLPERLRQRLSDSITPTFLGIGTTGDTTLRDSIRKAIGVDLWK